MKQKDLLEGLKVDDEQEQFDDESEYSSWKKDRGQEFGSNTSKRSLKPYLFVGAGLIVLVVLLVLFFPTNRGSQSANQLKMLEGRVKNIEDRLFALEGIEKRLAQGEERISRLDGLEKKLAHVEQQVADLAKISERAPAPKAQRAAKPAATTGQAAQPAPEVRYHQVRGGETLYSIARRYGLKVDELRQLNQLAPNAVIHPGDKLVVSRGKNG
ncbi:MAG TPA: LysM peptidoglycan-binding domain-containing protein [Syntrophobacteria bacterium]|nr:LysM peptidoglycan-binding domain-containing protein [Syntrophobacteria bacterium]